MTFRTLSLALVPALSLSFAACTDGDSDTGTDTDDTGEVLPANVTCTDTVCTATGVFEEDYRLKEGVEWVLNGPVSVGIDGDTCVDLEIPEGTTIFGATGTRSYLVVQRCSTLTAIGTADAPIVLTSAKADGTRAAGDFGGLILNGYGLNNLCSDPSDCNIDSEGGEEAGQYGGSDNGDTSGTIQYLRVEFGGDQVTEDDQLNGIAFQAVGNSTTVDHIQVHRNRDDGVEFFGGAVEVKYVVLTGVQDDSIDWTGGWTGKLQHGIVHQFDDIADMGIEADNNEDNNAATPRSKPTLSHVTFIGSKSAGSDGFRLRRGTGFNGHSLLVTNFTGECIDIDDTETYTNGQKAGELGIANSIVGDCAKNFDEDDGAPWSVETWYTNVASNRTITAASSVVENISTSSPNWHSKGDATSGGKAPTDSWFDAGTHVGGYAPGATWADGWTTVAPN